MSFSVLRFFLAKGDEEEGSILCLLRCFSGEEAFLRLSGVCTGAFWLAKAAASAAWRAAKICSGTISVNELDPMIESGTA